MTLWHMSWKVDGSKEPKYLTTGDKGVIADKVYEIIRSQRDQLRYVKCGDVTVMWGPAGGHGG